MKKFKEFYQKVLDPVTPEDWVNLCLTTDQDEPPRIKIPNHTHAEAFQAMWDFLSTSPRFKDAKRYKPIKNHNESFRVNVVGTRKFICVTWFLGKGKWPESVNVFWDHRM